MISLLSLECSDDELCTCAVGTDKKLQLKAVCFLHEQSCTIMMTFKKEARMKPELPFELKRTAERERLFD